MAPGGHIAIMGPNFRYTPQGVLRLADHTLIFTHKAIAEHLYAAGFEPVKVHPAVPALLVHRRSCRRRRRSRSAYLKLPLAWRLLGKQFLVIGRR